MKNIYKWVVFILIVSCSQEKNNLFEDITVRGGFIAFVETPPSSYNLLNINDLVINANVIDPNNNATDYSLTLIHNDIEIENFLTLNSFPSNLTITIQMILDALNLTVDDITIASEFRFIATVITPTGVFSGKRPDFNSDTNEQEGGNTASNLFASGKKNAMDFSIRFFLPPPKKLRGTSFEEPFPAPSDGDDYTRPDSEEDNDGELLNNAGERHVMHVATGTGVDDEIGFRSFFISNGNGGFTNEEIGVTQKTEDVGAYIDGVQGFQLEDVDGKYRLVFDEVIVNNGTNPKTGVQIQVFFRSTSWEDDDTIHVYAEIEKSGGVMETLDLLNISGSEIDDIEDKWNLIDSGFLDDVIAYTLIIDSEINHFSEEIYFDQMLVYIPDN